MRIPPPDPSEYLEQQYEYIRRVPDEYVVDTLARQIDESMALLRGLTEEQVTYRPAPSEWTIKEIIGHMSDTERVFAYRALAFARGDQASLPGFDQDEYMVDANFNDRTLADLCDEFTAIRQASLALFRSFTPEIVLRTGTANNNHSSVRTWIYCSAGHEHHHMESIRTVYLGKEG